MDRGAEGSLEYFKWIYAHADEAGPVEERWHEDLVLQQSPDVPGTAGTFHGLSGLREVNRELAEGYADIYWEPVEVRELGDSRYALRLEVGGKGHGSGIELANELGHLVELRDGKLFRLDVYMEWEDALRAAGQAQA